MTRTLADMTPAERDDCIGRWAEWTPVEDQTVLVVIEEVHQVRDYAGCVIPGVRYIELPRHRLAALTPRFDLPRAWTPSGEPVPGEWDDDNGHNYMRRFRSEWEWKHDTPQHIIDQHKEAP